MAAKKKKKDTRKAPEKKSAAKKTAKAAIAPAAMAPPARTHGLPRTFRTFRLNVPAPAKRGVRTYLANVPVSSILAATAEGVTTPYTRKNQKNLSTDEQALLLSTINSLISSGFWGSMVSIHADMSHRMHSMEGPVGTQRFLPWHRVFLMQLEKALQQLNPSVTIPYWDWTVDRDVPAWLAGFLPTVQADGQIFNVNRQPGVQWPDLPTQNDANAATANNDYTNFTTALEQVHNTVHMWVGGTMSIVETAPADPIFYLHHAQIDRIWSLWQTNHAGQNPNLVGDDAVMDPWSDTEPDTRSIAALGYQYG